MTRRAAADYSSIEEQLREKFSATATLEQQDFSAEKYESLRADVERYQRYARGGGGGGGGSGAGGKAKEEASNSAL